MNLGRSLLVFVPAMVLLASCAHKPKNNDGVGSDVSAQEMRFDAQGSDSGQIAGLSSVHFDYDKSNLTPEARKILADDAKWILDHAKMRVQIEGHTDARGSTEYNLALGERRAKSVQAYLVSLGVPARRLSTISYGKEKPLANGTTEEDYAKNRRANFVPSEVAHKLSLQK